MGSVPSVGQNKGGDMTFPRAAILGALMLARGSGQGVCKSQGRATAFRSHDQRVVLGICSGFSGAWQTASMRWPSGSTTKAA